MTTPSAPIRRAADHPKFAGTAVVDGEVSTESDAPPPKRIDTNAAKSRITGRKNEPDRSPRSVSTARQPRSTAPETPYVKGVLAPAVSTVYTQVGGVLTYIVQPVGQAIVFNADSCGTAWDNVAKQSPQVRRWLGNLTKTGAWGELFVAHLPILMTVMFTLGPDSFRERFSASLADSMTASDQPSGPASV